MLVSAGASSPCSWCLEDVGSLRNHCRVGKPREKLGAAGLGAAFLGKGGVKLGVQAFQRAPQTGFFPGPRGENLGCCCPCPQSCLLHLRPGPRRVFCWRLWTGARGLQRKQRGLSAGLGEGSWHPGAARGTRCCPRSIASRRVGVPQAARAVVPESNLI